MSKYDDVIRSLERMFSDRSVPREVTLEYLKELHIEVTFLIEAIQQDINYHE